MIEKIITRLTSIPRTVFLIDGLGALLTINILAVILKLLYPYIGLPQEVIKSLLWAAVVLCVYSLNCYLWQRKNLAQFIRIICIANLLYCCVTLALVVYHSSTLRLLGWVYFISEIIVICTLAYIEYRVAEKIR